MNKILLEIGTEEIPSVYVDNALKELKNNATKELQQLYIEHGNIYTYGTPRRLVVYIENVQGQQKDVFQKTKGPSKVFAFDGDGNLQKSAIKFAQSNHVKPEDLVTEKTSKGEYLFAKKTIKGEKTESLMPEVCLKLIKIFSFPKSMRWGETSLRFIRPIRWILALYNECVIPFSLESLKSDCISYGHRLLSPEAVKIDNVDHYFRVMEGCFVAIDPEKRKKMISEQIIKIIQEHHWKESVDKTLLDEVKNLVEYPRVLLGQFDKNYLELPAEVLKAVMIKHQKYFPVYDGNGLLSPFFFVVINGNDDKYKNIIVRGNERVLKARLEDARFFYQEDQKVAEKKLKPLDMNIEKLKAIVYQENSGSMYDKVERLVALTEKIGNELQLDSHIAWIIKRSAQLCKSDLVSEMAKEFPELQGTIGKEYALLQGEDKQVATTIFEHYLPRFSGDDLPETISGSVLSVADKLDNIVSCFVNGIIPDGSQDPYALRRQSLGILHIILNNNMNFSMDSTINFNAKLLLKDRNFQEEKEIDKEKVYHAIIDFILQRFRYLLLEKGYKYDVIDAVLAKQPKSIIDALLRIKAIQEIYHLPKFNKIITAATRTLNLSKNSHIDQVNCTIFQEKEEHILYKHYLEAKQNIVKACMEQRYKEVFEYLEEMTEPVDSFFDHVLVMAKDDKIRNNRLSLLNTLTKIYHIVADLSKIALAKGNFK